MGPIGQMSGSSVSFADSDGAGSAPAAAPLPLRPSQSYRNAWNEENSDVAKHQETVAQAFCVFGLPRATPLQPLSTAQEEEYVLANVCLITAGETPPDCYDVIMRTECGQRAVLSQGGSNSNHAKERDASTAIFLAQRLALRRHCPRPITALVLVDVEHGEEPPSGFEPVNRTADAEGYSVGRTQLYVSRASGTSKWTSRSGSS